MDSFNYYDFRIKSVTEKINRETDFYQKCEYSAVNEIKEYILYLGGRISGRQPNNNNSKQQYYDKDKGKVEIEKMDLTKYGKDLDVLVFKKPWNKLKEFHKIMKIKEFVNDLKYNDEIDKTIVKKNRDRLTVKIILGIKEKKFGKNKSEVIYDQEKMVITSISCLHLSKSTGIYKIFWGN